MRGIIIVSAMIALAGCTAMDSPAPAKVSWQYGARKRRWGGLSGTSADLQACLRPGV